MHAYTLEPQTSPRLTGSTSGVEEPGQEINEVPKSYGNGEPGSQASGRGLELYGDNKGRKR